MNSKPNLKDSQLVEPLPALEGWTPALDPNVTAAALLARTCPPGTSTEDAYRGLVSLNAQLATAPEGEILEALTRQAAILDALFLSYTGKALACPRTDHAALLQATALKCQRAHMGVMGAIRQIHEDKRNVEAIEAD